MAGESAIQEDRLPESFLQRLRELEEAYLTSADPIEQSGFHGGPKRWRREREPIVEAADGDGDLLDVGCANGYLLECLVSWARERGRRLKPYGVDIGPRLIELAKKRLPEFTSHFWVANAWDWQPPRQFRYVYTLTDSVPDPLLAPYLHRLLDRLVEPGGRLIVGNYGSRSRGTPPLPVADLLASFGLPVAGQSSGGDPPVSRFAWVDRPLGGHA